MGAACSPAEAASLAGAFAKGGVASLTSPKLFAQFAARMITNAPEIFDLAEALSSGPAAILTQCAGRVIDVDSPDALLHAYQIAAAAIHQPSHLGLLAALHKSPDLHRQFSADSLPTLVVDAIAQDLAKCPADLGNFSDLINDPAALRERIAAAFEEGRSTLVEMAAPESWLNKRSVGGPSRAVSLVRDAINSSDMRQQLIADSLFDRHVRLIDLVSEAERHAQNRLWTEANELMQQAQELRLRLGTAIKDEIASAADRKLEQLQELINEHSLETHSADRSANSLDALHAPAPAALPLTLTYRALCSDVFVILSPLEAPILCYETDSHIPWMERLDRQRLNDLPLPAELKGQNRDTCVLCIRKGSERIAKFSELLPEPHADRIQPIVSALKAHVLLPQNLAGIRLFVASPK